MTRDEIKKLVADLKLFGPTGKFNRYIAIPDELIKACFDNTPCCLSPEFKDRLYWVLNDLYDYAACVTCHKKIIVQIKNFSSKFKYQAYCNASCRLRDPELRAAYDQERLERTGYRNSMQDPAVREKVAATNMERYGAPNPFQAESIKQRIRDKIKERYGVNYISQAPEIRERIKKTCMQRYGVSHVMKYPVIRDAASRTCRKRYGVDNPTQAHQFQAKRRATNLKRYGVENPAHTEKGRRTCKIRYGVYHPMQHFATFQRVLRARFKIKTFVTETGAIFKYQGYEDVALRHLLQEDVAEADILINRRDIPKIFYFNTAKQRNARYYPDIYVKSRNLLIEVKSEYTFKLNIQETLDKQQACIKLGFKHIIMICDKKRILNII